MKKIVLNIFQCLLFSKQWIPVERRVFYLNLQLIQSKVIQLIDKHVHQAFVYQFDEEITTKIIENLPQKQTFIYDTLTRNSNFEPNLSGNKSRIRVILGIVAIRL